MQAYLKRGTAMSAYCMHGMLASSSAYSIMAESPAAPEMWGTSAAMAMGSVYHR